MATQETNQLDAMIASRRALLMGGGAAALAALVTPRAAHAALNVGTLTDNDILNFALNLEYLEANFYYLAAFGVPISTSGNALVTAAGGVNASAGIGTGSGTTAGGGGTVTVKSSPRVPFANPIVAAYAAEIAVDEGKHVAFLRNALGSAAVAQPNLDLTASFNGLASAAGIGSTFDPFASDANFLIGAYIFEDVGVTAYEGAAAFIKSKDLLTAAGGILAVEAYHAGLVRSTINYLDPTNSLGYLTLTQKISTLRASLSNAAASSNPAPYNTYDHNPDDIGLTTGQTVSLAGTTATSSTIVDADYNDSDPAPMITFARSTTQVLNIVTAGNGNTTNVQAKGGFFPNGLNGTIG